MSPKYPNRIRELRRAKKMSQEALGEAIGTSNQQISMLETGTRQLTTGWLKRLAIGLGCTPSDLLPYTDHGPTLRLPPKIRELVDLVSGLTPADQSVVLDVVETVAKALQGRKRSRQ